MTIVEFCDVANIECHVYHAPGAASAWIAKLPRCETKENEGDAMLLGVSGFGKDPEAAIDAMVAQIRGRILIIDAMKDTRRQLQVPMTLDRY